MIGASDAILFCPGEAELASSADTTGEANPYEASNLQAGSATRPHCHNPTDSFVSTHVRTLDVCDGVSVGTGCSSILGVEITLTNTGIEDLRQYLVLTRDRDRIVIVKFHLASKFGDKSYSLSLWDLHRHHVDTPSLEQSSVFPSGYSLVRVMGAINSLVMYRIIATMITC